MIPAYLLTLDDDMMHEGVGNLYFRSSVPEFFTSDTRSPRFCKGVLRTLVRRGMLVSEC